MDTLTKLQSDFELFRLDFNEREKERKELETELTTSINHLAKLLEKHGYPEEDRSEGFGSKLNLQKQHGVAQSTSSIKTGAGSGQAHNLKDNEKSPQGSAPSTLQEMSVETMAYWMFKLFHLSSGMGPSIMVFNNSPKKEDWLRLAAGVTNEMREL